MDEAKDSETLLDSFEGYDTDDETGDCCGLLLSLLECTSMDTQAFKHSVLNYRLYIINSDGEEKLQFGGSQVKMKLFGIEGADGGWGSRLSSSRLQDAKNKLMENDKLTVAALVSIHLCTSIHKTVTIILFYLRLKSTCASIRTSTNP